MQRSLASIRALVLPFTAVFFHFPGLSTETTIRRFKASWRTDWKLGLNRRFTCFSIKTKSTRSASVQKFVQKNRQPVRKKIAPGFDGARFFMTSHFVLPLF